LETKTIHVKEKILTSLKTKYKAFGFGEKTLEQVAEYLGQTVTDDNGIEPAVNGAEIILKAFQSDIDKRVTEAVAKAKAEPPKPPEPPKPTPPEPPKPDDVPAWAKGILDRLDTYEKREKQTILASKVKAALEKKNIPPLYLVGRDLSVEKEEDIETLVNQIDANYKEYYQGEINKGVIIATPPDAGGDKAGAALAKQIAEKRNNPAASTDGVVAKKIV
jgi:hypothetical protein